MNIDSRQISAPAHQDEYAGIKRVAELAKCAPSKIYRLAVLGRIDVKIERGEKPLYSVADVLRVASR